MKLFFFFKQKTAYEMRISDWSSDVCSSDLVGIGPARSLHRPCRDFRGAQQRPDVLDHGRFHHTSIEADEAVTALAGAGPDRIHRGVIAVMPTALLGDGRCHGDAPIGEDEPLQERSEEHTSELQSLMRISYDV